jgi:hypothetical protein
VVSTADVVSAPVAADVAAADRCVTSRITTRASRMAPMARRITVSSTAAMNAHPAAIPTSTAGASRNSARQSVWA